MDVSRLTEKPAGRRPIETRVLPLDPPRRGRRPRPRRGRPRRQGLLGLPAGRGIRDARRLRRRGPLQGAEAKALGADRRPRPRPDEAGRARHADGRASRPACSRCWSPPPWSRSASTSPTRPSSSSSMPSASASPSSTSSAAASGEATALRSASSSTRRRSAPSPRDRLRIMRETEDGFVIAEEDLRLRGGGEILGTRQSGMPGFRIANIEHHAALMEIARDDAQMIVDTDPDLASRTRRGAPPPPLSLRPRRGGPPYSRRVASARTRRAASARVIGLPPLAVSADDPSGATSPAEITTLAASSADRSRKITSCRLHIGQIASDMRGRHEHRQYFGIQPAVDQLVANLALGFADQEGDRPHVLPWKLDHHDGFERLGVGFQRRLEELLEAAIEIPDAAASGRGSTRPRTPGSCRRGWRRGTRAA